MAQFDMRPEEVQFHARSLNEEVKRMVELEKQLKAAFNELDQSWVSNEKEYFKSVAYKDFEDLERMLVSLNSFATTANSIANSRIERENAATNAMSSYM